MKVIRDNSPTVEVKHEHREGHAREKNFHHRITLTSTDSHGCVQPSSAKSEVKMTITISGTSRKKDSQGFLL